MVVGGGGGYLLVSSAGLPEWGLFGNLGLGLGSIGTSWPLSMSVGFVRRSVSGSTIVLEGIV